MIVVHELAHLKEKDHNKAFYQPLLPYGSRSTINLSLIRDFADASGAVGTINFENAFPVSFNGVGHKIGAFNISSLIPPHVKDDDL